MRTYFGVLPDHDPAVSHDVLEREASADGVGVAADRADPRGVEVSALDCVRCRLRGWAVQWQGASGCVPRGSCAEGQNGSLARVRGLMTGVPPRAERPAAGIDRFSSGQVEVRYAATVRCWKR